MFRDLRGGDHLCYVCQHKMLCLLDMGIVLIVLIVLCAVLFAAMRIYTAHEERTRAAAPRNANRYNAENLEAHPDSVLTGKRILFLGSSVTYGVAAQGQSFVELFETLDGVKAIKEAKSGTTLVDKNSILALIAFGNGDSYECAFYQKQ